MIIGFNKSITNLMLYDRYLRKNIEETKNKSDSSKRVNDNL